VEEAEEEGRKERCQEVWCKENKLREQKSRGGVGGDFLVITGKSLACTA